MDYEGGIEKDMTSMDQRSFYEIVEKRYDAKQIYKGLAALPEKQRNRIYAHYFLGMSKTAIARVLGC